MAYETMKAHPAHLKTETTPIEVSVSSSDGKAGRYIWPADVTTIEERPLSEYSGTQVEEPIMNKKRFFHNVFSEVIEGLELRALRRNAEQAKTSHKWNLGQTDEIVRIEGLGSRTKSISVAREAVSALDPYNIKNMGINYSSLEVAKFITDFLKDNNRYKDIKDLACGVAERRMKQKVSVLEVNPLAVAVATPPDPLVKYAIDILEKSNNQELIKKVVLGAGNHGSFTTARYAAEALLRNGGKSEVIDATVQLCERLKFLDEKCIHLAGTL